MNNLPIFLNIGLKCASNDILFINDQKWSLLTFWECFIPHTFVPNFKS